ncbi:MAG TPA: HAD family hydrolase [Rhizomicrobium sp.]|jgi:membrane protein
MSLKAVFLDIDGTLVDSNEFHAMAWQEAFRDQGHYIELKAIRGQIGKGADQLIPALLPGTAEEAEKAMGDRQGEIFRTRYRGQVRPFPHASDLMETLHVKGMKVLLASSSDKAEVDFYADLLHAAPFLTGTISKNDVKNSKPAGDIFAAALAKVFPLTASETLVIGDTPYDVESALRSGIKTIGLRSGGFSEERLSGAGAPYVYGSIKDIFENFDASPLNRK